MPVFKSEMKEKQGSQRSLFTRETEKSPSITCTALVRPDQSNQDKDERHRRVDDVAVDSSPAVNGLNEDLLLFGVSGSSPSLEP